MPKRPSSNPVSSRLSVSILFVSKRWYMNGGAIPQEEVGKRSTQALSKWHMSQFMAYLLYHLVFLHAGGMDRGGRWGGGQL
ncbi:hypothetical protein E2C01_025108 [Portunus trituberculatus]|uniref:Uncharacterized protein n=1 Tax=Portunus trituberculatus TaxID=210409 RepID=A0A5B7ECE3_PORTR|nr:hypothetical protein [Portunus trituberculatus]